MPVDIFATKGIEYLFIITFLLGWIVFWRLLRSSTVAVNVDRSLPAPWFSVPTDRLFHQGHTWAKQQADGRVRVGVDDFAQKLVGVPQALRLPEVGERVEQGERGFGLEVDGRTIEVLAPVTGEVVALNQASLRNPGLINDQPYDAGWLIDVRPERPSTQRTNLLAGALAVEWMEQSAEALRSRMTDGLGVVLQDGGLPVTGIARDLSAGEWDEIAREFLLSS